MFNRRKKEHEDIESFSPWESYSDLYCGLLLVFVLLFFFAIYQYVSARETNIADTEALQESMQEEHDTVLAMLKTQMENQQSAYDEKVSELESQQTTLSLLKTHLENQQEELEEKDKRLSAQETELSDQAALLETRQQELETQAQTLETQEKTISGQQDQLNVQQTRLTEQEDQLKEQQTQLKEQQTQLKQQQTRLDQQESELAVQDQKLKEQQQLLDEQAVQIEQIVGVRSQLIDVLNRELKANHIEVQADKSTGAIAFASTILFDVDSNELNETGKEFFRTFMPVYLDVLFQKDFEDYIAEIIVEGHTDSSGTYMHNLELSQKRAFSVAEYCVQEDNDFLTKDAVARLRELITVNGCADKAPVYNADGSVNDEASRRVEVKFRLKDQEMIQAMDEILNQ